mgnify:CR=1 FL=1
MRGKPVGDRDFGLVRRAWKGMLVLSVMDSADPLPRENRPTKVGADDSYCESTH